jgi:hypothetical protein
MVILQETAYLDLTENVARKFVLSLTDREDTCTIFLYPQWEGIILQNH